jgi:hypothetical protein
MKIFRGPESQPFEYTNTPQVRVFNGVGHEGVDDVDLSLATEPWSGVAVVKARISKDAKERKSVIHIVLEDNDIIALHQGLVRGLLQSRKNADEASCELTRLNMSSIVGIDQNDLSKSLSKVLRLIQ